MNKENTLFGIVGLLAGLIIGFVFANSVNQRNAAVVPITTGPTTTASANSNIPPGHPDIGAGGTTTGGTGGMQPEVQAALEQA